MITIGEIAINVGDIAADGGMGQSLSPLGLTFRDTLSITTDDPEQTELYSEENDSPEYIAERAGKISVNFSVMNPDPDTLAKLLGGTVSGEGDAAVWTAPENLPSIEKSVEIVPKQGLSISIPRLKMVCKIDWSNVGTTPLVITVAGTALNPTKAGVGKISAQKYVAA